MASLRMAAGVRWTLVSRLVRADARRPVVRDRLAPATRRPVASADRTAGADPPPQRTDAAWPAASSPPVMQDAAPTNDGQTFGVTRGLSPGQVPWHWKRRAEGPADRRGADRRSDRARHGRRRQHGKPEARQRLRPRRHHLDRDRRRWVLFWAWFFSLRKYHLPWAASAFAAMSRKFLGVAAALIVGRSACDQHPEQRERLRLPRVDRSGASGKRGDDLPPHLDRPPAVRRARRARRAGRRGEDLPRLRVPGARALVGAAARRPLVGPHLRPLAPAALGAGPIFCLGALLAAAFYWTKSIYTNITFHAIFNTLGILAWWFAKGK